MIYSNNAGDSETFEMGEKCGLFGNVNDGLPISGAGGKLVREGTEDEKQLEIIREAIQVFAKNGDISKEEQDIIEKLDSALGKIDVVINRDKNYATISLNMGDMDTVDFGTRSLKRQLTDNLGITDTMGKEGRVLKKAFEQYSKDGNLSKADIEMIEKIDEVFSNADITINSKDQTGIIISDNAQVYNLKVAKPENSKS